MMGVWSAIDKPAKVWYRITDRSVIKELLSEETGDESIIERIMPTKIKDVQPPSGMARRLYRLPIWLFRLHLGWLLMGHFLLLAHTGRKSGLPRQTVLEVLWHEKAGDVYYVLAAWGEQSDWVKNIEQTPQVTIADGRRRFRAQAARLSPEEAEVKVLAYARQHPRLVRYLPRLLGYRTDGTEEDLRALARLGIVVAFEPSSTLLPSGNV